jgi:hypothetical protein
VGLLPPLHPDVLATSSWACRSAKAKITIRSSR